MEAERLASVWVVPASAFDSNANAIAHAAYIVLGMKRFVRAREVKDFDMAKVSRSEVYNAGPGIVPEREILLRFAALPCSNASFSPASTKLFLDG